MHPKEENKPTNINNNVANEINYYMAYEKKIFTSL